MMLGLGTAAKWGSPGILLRTGLSGTALLIGVSRNELRRLFVDPSTDCERSAHMKVPIQEKVAELESRVALLEKALNLHSTITHTFSSSPPDGVMWKHWDNMWQEFNLVMKTAFGKKP